MKGSARSHEWHRFPSLPRFFRTPSAPPLPAPTSTVVSISSPFSKGRDSRHPQPQHDRCIACRNIVIVVLRDPPLSALPSAILVCAHASSSSVRSSTLRSAPPLSPYVRTQLSTPTRISVCAWPLARTLLSERALPQRWTAPMAMMRSCSAPLTPAVVAIPARSSLTATHAAVMIDRDLAPAPASSNGVRTMGGFADVRPRGFAPCFLRPTASVHRPFVL